RLLAAPPLEFSVDVDQTARVDDVVGGVEHPPLMQDLAVTSFGEHVVGGPRDDLDVEAGDGLVVDRRAERAGGINVRIHVVDGVGLHAGGTELFDDTRYPLFIDVADDQLCPLRREMPAEMVADVTDALHRHAAAAQAVTPPPRLGGGLHPAVGAVGGYGRGVARGPGQSGDMVRLHVDVVHVRDGGAHVLGGGVAAAEALAVPTVRAEEPL